MTHQFQLQDDGSKASQSSVLETLLLQEEILRHIPRTALLQRPALTQKVQAASNSHPPYAFSCLFYGITPIPGLPVSDGTFDVPFVSLFENMVELSMNCARSLLKEPPNPSRMREVFSQSLLLLDEVAGRIDSPIRVSWNPSKWLDAILQCIEHKVRQCASLACMLN